MEAYDYPNSLVAFPNTSYRMVGCCRNLGLAAPRWCMGIPYARTNHDFARSARAVCVGGRDGLEDCHMTVGIFMPEGTEARICAEIAARQQMGLSKYGTTVAESRIGLREWLVHAKQEAMDQAIYLQRAIEEIDAQEGRKHG